MTQDQPLFVFDLDSTITQCELLPLLAREISAEAQMEALTERAMGRGEPFEQNFRARVELLKDIPLPRARRIAASMPLFPKIADFIRRNPDRCRILTGNLDVWIEELIRDLDMRGRCLCSRAAVSGDRLLGVERVLDKGEAARSLPHPFVAVGDGDNDIGLLRAADFGVAFSGARSASPALQAAADGLAQSEEELMKLLSGFLRDPDFAG